MYYTKGSQPVNTRVVSRYISMNKNTSHNVTCYFSYDSLLTNVVVI